MKLKMSEHSLFALLMRKPWWISVVIAVVLMLAAGALLPRNLAVYSVSTGLPFLVVGVIAAFRQWRIPSAAQVTQRLEVVRAMSWRDFSGAVEQAFLKDDYEVERQAGSGADFAVRKAGHTVLVSCKRWKAASHGVEPLRELHAAITARDADAGIYITTGELTDNARRFTQENNISVMQGADLAKLLSTLPKQAAGHR
jgi:restriction system protein